MLRQSNKQPNWSSNRGSASTSTPASTSAPTPTPARAPRPPVRDHAFLQSKSATLERQTSDLSGGSPYKVRLRRLVNQLALEARVERARLQKAKTLLPDGNVVMLAPCIAYSAPGVPKPEPWTMVLDRVWNSGFKEASGNNEEKQDAVTNWLLAARENRAFQDLKAEKINTSIPGTAQGIADKATDWAHSEVVAAADPELDDMLRAALLKFVHDARSAHPDGEIVVRDALVTVRSEPNVMCCRACRFAVKEIGQRFARLAEEVLGGTSGFRFSSNKLTGTFVTARRQFGSQGVAYNKKTLPRIPSRSSAVGGGHHDFEKVARDGKDGKPAPVYDSPPDTPEEHQFYDPGKGEVETDEHRAAAELEQTALDKKRKRNANRVLKNAAKKAAATAGATTTTTTTTTTDTTDAAGGSARPAKRRRTTPKNKPKTRRNRSKRKGKQVDRISDEEHESPDNRESEEHDHADGEKEADDGAADLYAEMKRERRELRAELEDEEPEDREDEEHEDGSEAAFSLFGAGDLKGGWNAAD